MPYHPQLEHNCFHFFFLEGFFQLVSSFLSNVGKFQIIKGRAAPILLGVKIFKEVYDMLGNAFPVLQLSIPIHQRSNVVAPHSSGCQSMEKLGFFVSSTIDSVTSASI